MPQETGTPTIIHEQSKVVSPRISEANQKFYGMMFENINQGADYTLDAFPHLYKNTMESLKGRFSRGELMLMIDVNKGSFLTAIMAGQHLNAKVADGIARNYLDAKWEIDGKILKEKMAAVSIFEIACLEIWVNSFWAQDDHGNINEYAAEMTGEDKCNHKYGDGEATESDLKKFKPGDICSICKCTLGTDEYWYIEREQASGYPDFNEQVHGEL